MKCPEYKFPLPKPDSVRTNVCQLRHALLRLRDASDAKTIVAQKRAASMSLRKLHDKFVGTARGQGCLGAIYRTRKAMYLGPGTETTVHCEHTVPVSLVVEHLLNFSKLCHPSDEESLLRKIMNVSIITACSQHERSCTNGLAKPRQYEGHTDAKIWHRHHPQLVGAVDWPPNANPFMRYDCTSLEVFYLPTCELIDLKEYTLEDHRARIDHLPAYDILQYYWR